MVQAVRCFVVVMARTSGSPHCSVVAAPPESKADMDPTIAKASSQARAAACWSADPSVRVS